MNAQATNEVTGQEAAGARKPLIQTVTGRVVSSRSWPSM